MSILAGCSSNGGDSGSASGDASFKIGTIGPLTGANASYGKSVTQAVELGCRISRLRSCRLSARPRTTRRTARRPSTPSTPCSTGACRPSSVRPPRVRRSPLPPSAATTPDVHDHPVRVLRGRYQGQGLRLPGLLYRPQPRCQRCQVPGREVCEREVRAVL